MALIAGTRLAPYEVDGLIDAGGVCEVCKARDARLGRTVAIKILPANLASDAERRARFEREARTIASLGHRHICTYTTSATAKACRTSSWSTSRARRWSHGSRNGRSAWTRCST